MVFLRYNRIMKKRENKVWNGVLIAAAVIGMLVVVSAVVFALRERVVSTGDDVKIVVEDVAGRERTQAEIDNEDDSIPTVGPVVDYLIDIRDPEAVAGKSDYVALVRIEKIEGFGNYNEIAGTYTTPYTYGRMMVLENFKGELPVGETVKFYRNGGVLTAEEYYAGEDEEKRAKYAELNADDPDLWTKKTRHMAIGDIKPEFGKTYLVYLLPRKGEEGAYGMIAAQGGLA